MKGNGAYYACGEVCPDAAYWTCTLVRDHYGPHVAKGVGPDPLAKWDKDAIQDDLREIAKAT